MLCKNSHDMTPQQQYCSTCGAEPKFASSGSSSRPGRPVSRNLKFGIGIAVSVLLVVNIFGISSGGEQKKRVRHNGGNSNSSGVSIDRRVARCTVPLASWVIYVENGLVNNDNSAAMDAYYTFGTTSSTASWLVGEAAAYLAESFDIGNSQATVNMATSVRSQCASWGYPSLTSPN
jgi:hypothetical protein